MAKTKLFFFYGLYYLSLAMVETLYIAVALISLVRRALIKCIGVIAQMAGYLADLFFFSCEDWLYYLQDKTIFLRRRL